ncbi:MAG: hypothetical protein M3Y27_16405 [Acidobacteriota bacterium]|nr:hypothetical protein [Acidobacteriota bacterium]
MLWITLGGRDQLVASPGATLAIRVDAAEAVGQHVNFDVDAEGLQRLR